MFEPKASLLNRRLNPLAWPGTAGALFGDTPFRASRKGYAGVGSRPTVPFCFFTPLVLVRGAHYIYLLKTRKSLEKRSYLRGPELLALRK